MPGPGLAQRFRAALEDLDVPESALVADLVAQVDAAIGEATGGPGGPGDAGGAGEASTLSADRAAAVAFSVLTGVVSLAERADADDADDPDDPDHPGGPDGPGGRRALALRRAEELAALQAEVARRAPQDVASTSARRLAATVLQRGPLPRRRPRSRG